MEIYVVKISIFLSFFLVFNKDFIKCIAFTCISASNAASDYVTN